MHHSDDYDDDNADDDDYWGFLWMKPGVISFKGSEQRWKGEKLGSHGFDHSIIYSKSKSWHVVDRYMI